MKLSPSERNRSTESVGAIATVTPKLQEVVCARASVAVQLTVEEPTGTATPEAGVHATLTGAVPPVACGVTYVNGTGCPVVVRSATGAGHVNASGAAVGVVGWVGVDGDEDPPPQAARVRAAEAAASRRRILPRFCAGNLKF
ncbi:hypothetical protein TBR22_A04950 [Luteitalea sp. TBR-22]|nr:hypothetical protein TBR22_A04950 [Luteitalea sp. TBR-22]